MKTMCPAGNEKLKTRFHTKTNKILLHYKEIFSNVPLPRSDYFDRGFRLVYLEFRILNQYYYQSYFSEFNSSTSYCWLILTVIP